MPPIPDAAFDSPRYVQSEDGTSIATYDLGSGDESGRDNSGADLLMAHATGLCAGVWGPLAGALGDSVPAETGAAAPRIVTFDARGHGHSQEPATAMDWADTAADVLAVVDALGLERPFGVGHSMGGASLVLAELARPGTFRGLWLFEPIIFPAELREDEPSPNPLSIGAMRRRDHFESAEAAFANFASKRPFSEIDPDALRGYVTHGFETLPDRSVRLRCRPEFESSTYQMGGQHDAGDHLHTLGCPVTIVHGVDEGGAALLAPLAAAKVPLSVLEEIGTVGHFGPIQDTAASAASIARAVGRSVTAAS